MSIKRNTVNVVSYDNPGFVNGLGRTVSQQFDTEENDDDDEQNVKHNCCTAWIEKIQIQFRTFIKKHHKILKQIFYLSLVLLYAVYFCFAVLHSQLKDEDDIRLFWITAAVILVSTLSYFQKPLARIFTSCTSCFPLAFTDKISWIVLCLIGVFAICFIAFDVFVTSGNARNLVSLGGLCIYVSLLFIFSHSPAQVKWRPVLWGLALQFTLGVIILRWDIGFAAFEWLGERVSEFLAHSDAGAKFVFGDPQYEDHFFAFKALPVVIFFSTFVSILYYLGAMQAIIKTIATGMQVVMDTSPGESLSAAGNIFIGQTEAPLLIKPLIHDMSTSELHAVMTGGFATIAGTVMAAFILFGVKANHLLSASVMSAPAALGMSKLFYPETKKGKKKCRDVMSTMIDSKEGNVIEAASAGASAAINLVANIAANLIAFVAMLHFVNATFTWFGARVGIHDLTLELAMSYLLWPFAFVMGVDAEDCLKVAEFIGVKIVLNEFIAYERLGECIQNKHIHSDWTTMWNGTSVKLGNGTYILSGDPTIDFTRTSVDFNKWYVGTTGAVLPTGNETVTGVFQLLAGMLTERSEVISTFALCGFANFGSLGIMLGGLGALVPERKPELAATVLRAMICGTMTCFMTASIAGLLYQPAG